MISAKTITNCLEKHLSFLENVINVANCHMVDFFTNELFKSVLPDKLRLEIEQIGIENAIDILATSKPKDSAPHLSKFLEDTDNLTLYNCQDVCIGVNDLLNKIREWGFESHPGLRMKVFMNSKKSHEVEIMSTVAATVSKLSETSHLIDLGDGKGYLSSMMAMHHGIPVLGVDACAANTEGAAKRAIKLQKQWHGIAKTSAPSKTDDAGSENLYKRTTQFVTETTCFKNSLREHFRLEEAQLETLRLGLVGLHTCGCLAVASLKLFCTNENVRTICNVGCCYHLLDADSTTRAEAFPLSEYLKNQRRVKITRNCKMLSMQSVDRQTVNNQSPNEILFYRSVLQVFLCRRFDTAGMDTRVGRLRRRGCKDFAEYAEYALERLGIETGAGGYRAELEAVYREFESKRSTLNAFYMIRARLGPVIEAVILLDRLLFLVENGHSNSTLVRLFNPVTSPRCYGIVSFKT